ncbi:MAG TPA: sigma-54 dependent transcriptional regulator [Terriglobales bacterium]|nr:sigma-54 dependent transcriptional regulator [Terriglobales bacterium]
MLGEAIRLWFCSPDAGFTQVIVNALGESEYDVRTSDSFEAEESEYQTHVWSDVVLLDVRALLREGDLERTYQLLDRLHSRHVVPAPPIVTIIPEDERTMTLRLMERGVHDVVTNPPNMTELRLILRRAHRYFQIERELEQLRSQSQCAGSFDGLIGQSKKMQDIFVLCRKAASCDVSVMITGETGTGKELLARAIHRYSSRASQPFVAFSCANLPETLVEDELFGHEKGAYTGAAGIRRGRIETADQGTLFLDEVGDMAVGLQPKFLRVLQERTFERLGSCKPIPVNMRVICATNRNPEEMIKEGKFRDDLYYRLNVVQIHLPPLRERRDDIPLLAYTFLERFAKQFGKTVNKFSRAALQRLEEYEWPGNVRELENTIQRAVVMTDGEVIEPWHFPAAMQTQEAEPEEVTDAMSNYYEEEVRRFKRRLLLRTLEECSWQKSSSARRLGVARGYLHRLIHQLHIEEPEVAATLSRSCGRVAVPK